MAKSNGGKAGSLNRDHRGRFLARGGTDPTIDLLHQSWAEETKLSQVYLEICKQLRQPRLARALEIKKAPSGWRVGRGAETFFLGLASGIVFAEKDRDNQRVSVLELLSQASAIRRDMSQIEDKRRRLYLQEIGARA